ncbi:hypothetical protein PHMEG_0007265 [Phytophthora megakarya]|uniref:START domain-containing protein n=1 Tax=Phytophthora megakarya TaxID=4795 RepID=A0A225WNA3_9STRA|nr:hypothetical protein PHMEG_0007265 [Phytophthora megakarya]
MTKPLPLPPRFFKCPELSEREEHYLVGKAKESAKALVDATRNNEGPVRWEEAGMHRGVQMYKGEARYPEAVVGESITYGCGATTIQSTLDEVADFFDVSTHEKVAEFVESCADVLDAQLLYVIEDPTLLNDPKYNVRGQRSGFSKMLNANQVTVKWFAMDMPSKLPLKNRDFLTVECQSTFMDNRDFLTVECQSTFMDVSGRRGWVRSYHSIKLPCCPELNDYSLVRGSFYHTGYVFVESERPGFLDVIYSAQVNLKGSMKVPTSIMTIQKKRLSSIADLQKMITRRRLGAQRFLGDLELVPKSQRTRCNLCSNNTEWEVSIPGQGVRKVRVCSKCAQNTDPSVFEDLPASEQYSETNSAHDEDPPLMSVRAPGYQYERYNRSEGGSSPSSRGRRGRNSDGYQRQHSGRRGPYSNSYEESYSQSDSFQDPDPEYPRTMEMPGSDYASLDSDRYTNESGEFDEYPSSRSRREDSRKYDPRNPDMYDHTTYGVSPPPKFRDEEQRRALQRQQRALQQHQNKQRLLQRQQQQQEALMRRRQNQYEEEPDNYRDELESMSSSEFSEASGASSGHPSFLTSNSRDDEQRRKSVKSVGNQDLNVGNQAHNVGNQAHSVENLPHSIQIQQWEQQEAMFKNQDDLPPLDFDDEPADIEEGPGRRRVDLPSFPKTQATNSGQRTVSVADDEDRLDNSTGNDNSISGLSMSFGALLRPEDLRATEESISLSLDSSGQDHSVMTDSNPGTAGASAAKNRADVSKTTVVKLYQRILELTNKQHELESQPESDPDEKKEVARELEELYEKLNSQVEM